MPIYEYVCLVCKKEHEIIQRHNDTPLTKCPDCGGHMKKLISNTSFVLKGSGWYKTDYASTTADKATVADKKTGDKPGSKTKKKPKLTAKTE